MASYKVTYRDWDGAHETITVEADIVFADDHSNLMLVNGSTDVKAMFAKHLWVSIIQDKE